MPKKITYAIGGAADGVAPRNAHGMNTHREAARRLRAGKSAYCWGSEIWEPLAREHERRAEAQEALADTLPVVEAIYDETEERR